VNAPIDGAHPRCAGQCMYEIVGADYRVGNDSWAAGRSIDPM
jgi:hypothetical protein